MGSGRRALIGKGHSVRVGTGPALAVGLALASCARLGSNAVVVGQLQVSEPSLASAPELGVNSEKARQVLRAALEGTRSFAVRESPNPKTTPRVRLEVEGARRLSAQTAPAGGGDAGPDREVAEVTVALELIVPGPQGEIERTVAESSGRRPTGADAVGGSEPEARQAAFEGAFDGALRDAAAGLAAQLEVRKKSDQDLERDLSSGDVRTRDYAVRLLADRRNPAAVPLLLARLQDESPEVVRRAMGALVTIGDLRAVAPLIGLTFRRPPQFVAEVLYALGSLGGPDAEAYLYTLERGAAEVEVRRAAVEALAELRRRREETARATARPPDAPPGAPAGTPTAGAASPAGSPVEGAARP
jgi:hypothetical protein